VLHGLEDERGQIVADTICVDDSGPSMPPTLFTNLLSRGSSFGTCGNRLGGMELSEAGIRLGVEPGAPILLRLRRLRQHLRLQLTPVDSGTAPGDSTLPRAVARPINASARRSPLVYVTRPAVLVEQVAL
jgi:hypothetical protein